MWEQFQRTELLLGKAAMRRLAGARVAVFGIGGVGGYTAEALARSGIGALDLIDNDKVSLSNLNRQIIATRSSLGRDKVDVMRERILDINPELKVEIHNCFFLPETAGDFCFENYDYVVDAVDTVTAKLAIVEAARSAHVPIISSMGAGNKLDASRFQVADIYETKVCPLAKVMRRELKKRGIGSLKVVYSEEQAISHQSSFSEMTEADREDVPEIDRPDTAGASDTAHMAGRRSVPGSVAFVPSVAGLIIAGEVVKDLCGYGDCLS
ncbi:MAG: tRNA threonylcarbamoyladenosine dehydratase [Lachnospiraceae bacterium]|nr:tRNA threonylcarbamoyladenosine dehydratase [Lachnospiraceae bacterium]